MRTFILFVIILIAIVALIDNRKIYFNMMKDISQRRGNQLKWWNFIFILEIITFIGIICGILFI